MVYEFVIVFLLGTLIRGYGEKPTLFPNQIFTQTGVMQIQLSDKASATYTLPYKTELWGLPGISMLTINSLELQFPDLQINVNVTYVESQSNQSQMTVRVDSSLKKNFKLLTLRYYIAVDKYSSSNVFASYYHSISFDQKMGLKLSKYSTYFFTIIKKELNFSNQVGIFSSLTGFKMRSSVEQFDLHAEVFKQDNFQLKLYSLYPEYTNVYSVSVAILVFDIAKANAANFGQFSLQSFQTNQNQDIFTLVQEKNIREFNSMVGLTGISMKGKKLNYDISVTSGKIEIKTIEFDKITQEKIKVLLMSTYHCSDPQKQFLVEGDDQCVSECPIRKYFHKGSKTCKPCDYNCATCVLSGSCVGCSYNEDFRQFENGTCPPAKGHFESNIRVAGNCSSRCQKCTSSLFCEVCQSGFEISSSLQACVQTDLVPIIVAILQIFLCILFLTIFIVYIFRNCLIPKPKRSSMIPRNKFEPASINNMGQNEQDHQFYNFNDSMQSFNQLS